MNPRIAVVKVLLRAFLNCLSAISSLIRPPLREMIKEPIASRSRASGMVW